MKIVLAFCLLVGAGVQADAAYFHLIDIKHPQINAGMSVNKEISRPTSMVALITHSPIDGYLLIPELCWTPLAVGGGFKGGSLHIAAGPSFNMLPVMQTGLYAIIDALTPEDKYTNFKSWMKPATKGGADIVGAVGINMEYDFSDGKITTPYFIGVNWKF